MMHWKATFLVLALLVATLAGCSQPCYLHDCDDLMKRAGLPCDLTTNPDMQNRPTIPDILRPTDVNDPERAPWYITLHEAIALALENGETGIQSSRNFGLIDDDLVTVRSLGGNFSFGNSIRVLALDPAIIGTSIETNLARYDAVFRSVLSFITADFPTNSSSQFRNGQFTAAGVSLEKLLPSGGFASATLGSNTNQGINPSNNLYSNFRQTNFFSGTLNPQYTPDLQFAFSQPLLQGFGTTINSLLSQHPSVNQGGAQNLIRSGENAQPGIVIARIAFDQQRADFERQVNYLLANVEVAYWNLYGSFINLYSAEQALRQAHTTWKISKSKYDAGQIAITQYAQTRGQFEQFRGDRLQALGKVLEAERTLRGLLGLPMEDGKRLVPVDTPTVAPYIPDGDKAEAKATRERMWDEAIQQCMELRPELVMQRNDLKQKQLEVIREKNSLLPDIRAQFQYTVHGAGSRLDGDSVFGSGLTDNALRSLAGDHFNDYAMGLTGAIPLGYRAQNAAVRAAKLRLAQSYLQLREQEGRAQRYLVAQYRAVVENFKVIEARRAQREAFADQVEARFKEFTAGKTTADFLLEAQRQWAAALSSEYQAIVEYNNSLVRYQFAKGTLLAHNGIQIAESGLPECAQVRAVEHERQRAAAIACREEAAVVPHPPCDPENGVSGMPVMPVAVPPTLPALMKGAPPVPTKLDDHPYPVVRMPAGPSTPPVTLPPVVTVTPLQTPAGTHQMPLPLPPEAPMLLPPPK